MIPPVMFVDRLIKSKCQAPIVGGGKAGSGSITAPRVASSKLTVNPKSAHSGGVPDNVSPEYRSVTRSRTSGSPVDVRMHSIAPFCTIAAANVASGSTSGSTGRIVAENIPGSSVSAHG